MREKNGIILGAWVGCYHLYLREGGGDEFHHEFGIANTFQ